MHLDEDEKEKKVTDQEVEQEEEKVEETEEKDGKEEAGEKDESEEESKDENEEEGEEQETQAKKSPPIPEWMRKRLASYTKKAHDERRRADTLEAENTSLKKAVEALSAGRGKDEEDDEAERSEEARTRTNPNGKSNDELIEQRAEQIVAAKAFNKACDDLFDAGEKEFGKDWGVAMGNINDLGGFRENTTALSIIMELPNSHKIVHALGKDPELTDKIFGMSPVKMTVELTKLSDRLLAPKKEKISDAPEPVKTLRNGKQPKSEELKDNDSTAEWMRKREAQLAEK